MIRLRTFGGVSIERDGNPVAGAAEQRKALALLIAVASAGDRGISRDRLLALLWPESPPERARNALNQILHAIRRGMADDQVLLGVAELRLDPRAIAVDAREFDQALASGDLERGVLLYAGPFLDGFYLRDAPEFERWAEAQRERLADQFMRALESLARADAARCDYASAISRFRRLTATDPLNSRYTASLMEALVASGDPGGALQTAQAHTALLRVELNAPPDASIAVMAARLRRQGAERAAPTQSALRPPATGEILRSPVDAKEPADFAPEITGAPGQLTMLTLRASPRWRQRTTWAVAALGGAVGLGAVVVLAATLTPSDTGAAREGGDGNAALRLAVLPFENVGDSVDAYFADGMTDAVRGKLTALPGLEVIAAASSNQYKKTTKSPQQIGRELDVRYLLVGKVRWLKIAGVASRVQVSPELIEVTSAAARWGQPFDEPLTDVFRVQADIADRVARQLRVTLTPAAHQALTQPPTRSLDAYVAYLRGWQILNDRSSPLVDHRAAAAFGEAVRLDANFALAWAAMSEAYTKIAWGTFAPLASVEDSARDAAARAQALGPDLPETHIAQGLYEFYVRRNGRDAVTALEAGLRIDPTSVRLLRAIGNVEVFLGRWDSAVVHKEQALRLDPIDIGTLGDLGRDYLWLRRYPDARHLLDRALALDPTNLWIIENRAMVELAQGDLPAARAIVRAAPRNVDSGALVATLAGDFELIWLLDSAQVRLLLTMRPNAFRDGTFTWGFELALAYALRGDTIRMRAYADSAMAATDVLRKEAPDAPGPLVVGAELLAFLGKPKEAIEAARRAAGLTPVSRDAILGPYREHQLSLVYLWAGEPEKALDELEPLLKIPYYLSPGWLRIDPNFAPLRGNPRFERLIARPATGERPTA